MLIDGKQIAQEILNSVADEVKKMEKPPRLAAVLVGDPLTGSGQANRKFLELKKQAAKSVGIDFELYEFPEDITTQKLRKEIVNLSQASVNDGVIIELPLPKQINTQYILNAVPEEKDPDVLCQKAQSVFFTNRSLILPPAVEAVKQIFRKYDLEKDLPRSAISDSSDSAALPQSEILLRGKNCAIFGYGLLVGKPVSHWLATQSATVHIINEFTPNPAEISSKADIIVSGVGKRDIITANMVKKGAVVIDFARDVDFENVAPKASLITPPIGGCGPIVIAAALKNLVLLLK